MWGTNLCSMPGEVVANERTMSQAGANWGAIRYKNLEVWYLHMRIRFHTM